MLLFVRFAVANSYRFGSTVGTQVVRFCSKAVQYGGMGTIDSRMLVLASLNRNDASFDNNRPILEFSRSKNRGRTEILEFNNTIVSELKTVVRPHFILTGMGHEGSTLGVRTVPNFTSQQPCRVVLQIRVCSASP